MSWIYNTMSISTFGRLLGLAELLTAALLALKPWFPKASILGGLLASLFFLSTGGFTVLSANGQFLIKTSRFSAYRYGCSRTQLTRPVDRQ
jgi:uncharacterized membrane protein YkgB